jgi:hypothetical protein
VVLVGRCASKHEGFRAVAKVTAWMQEGMDAGYMQHCHRYFSTAVAATVCSVIVQPPTHPNSYLLHTPNPTMHPTTATKTTLSPPSPKPPAPPPRHDRLVCTR